VLRRLLFKPIKIEFMESFACVDHMSLSGKLLYYLLADHCYVQWKALQKRFPKSIYIGVESNQNTAILPPVAMNLSNPNPNTSLEWVFVTVGSTKFDALIEVLDYPHTVDILHGLGFRGIRFQIGRGTKRPTKIEEYCALQSQALNGFRCECYDFKPSLQQDMKEAGLIISHAGAGSITEGLRGKKRMVVVPNPLLMNNHQLQLALSLDHQRFLSCATLETLQELSQLAAVLHQTLTLTLLEFPEQSSQFIECLERVS
jgi:UDP-N-acetylglucosamine transferase subunit ALG13